MTWSQVYQRAQLVAAELAHCGSVGDRAAILAPQGLEYIVGLLGAIEAGFIAVPLSVPMFGTHDERVSAALTDCAPAVILTTSAVVNDIVSSVHGLPGPAPAVIEVDALDLDAPPAFQPPNTPQTKTALLQYTSGSTRVPAGVMVTQRNLVANLEQIKADYFEDSGGVPPSDTTVVSWLPFYHDMGLMLGIFGPIAYGLQRRVDEPDGVSAEARAVDAVSWRATRDRSRRRRTSRTNWRCDGRPTRTWPGWTWGTCSASSPVPNGYTPPRSDASPSGLPASTFLTRAIRSAYGLAEATVYVASALPGRPLPIARFSYEKLSAGQAKRCTDDAGVDLISHGPPRSCTVRIVDPETRVEKPAGKVGEIWVHGDNVAGRLLAKPATVGADLRRTARRSIAGHAAGTVASDRRFGRHLRRRALHRRSHQGSADRRWAQPLSRRHRGDDPGDHRRPRRGDLVPR